MQNHTFKSQAKKLLFITPRIDGAGGVQKFLSFRANYLQQKKGYSVHILTTNSHSNQIFFDFGKIDVVDQEIPGKGMFYFFNYLKIVRQYIKEIKPDLIVIVDNGLKGNLLPFFIKTNHNRIIYEQHGYRFYKEMNEKRNLYAKLKNQFQYRLVDYSMSKADCIVGLVPENKKEWKTDKMEIIPNPLPKEFFGLNIKDTIHKRVITVGRHAYQKGYDMLLDIWKEVLEDFPDWILEVYGHPDEVEDLNLAKRVKDLNLEKQVILQKPVKDIRDKYLNADFYVMSSRYEGFGNVLVEALACGLPCISFACPTGPSFIINDQENGFLVPCYDKKEFAQKIKELIADNELRSRMSKHAQESICRFDPDKIMEKWDDLYRKLLQ